MYHARFIENIKCNRVLMISACAIAFNRVFASECHVNINKEAASIRQEKKKEIWKNIEQWQNMR